MRRFASRTTLLITASCAALGVLGWSLFLHKTAHAPTAPPQTETPQTPPQTSGTPHSLIEPDSIWVVVNKQRPLPGDYEPEQLVPLGGQQMRSDAAKAIERLTEAAAQEGLSLKYISGYRSYSYQKQLYDAYAEKDGQAQADSYSARPGHSEHQTGLVMDIGNTDGECDLDICFGETAGGTWVRDHAHEYGFIIRYLEGKTDITGYQYEPWHLRYVGIELAREIHARQTTMEEYFALPAAPRY
ncbi:D-alanyl-D-alanine carboxypeptidase [Candidatus Saccharibacteria bacterium]|nr:MAG: D-alanyl-D-alanine carboxypeptidase [Candidatus Saccharibacteria bacterium]